LLGTPVAAKVSVSPGVEFKSVEGDPLFSHAFLVQAWAHFRVEAVLVHPEISRRIPQADDSWESHVTAKVDPRRNSAMSSPRRARVESWSVAGAYGPRGSRPGIEVFVVQ
jgi:hypothetical protein